MITASIDAKYARRAKRGVMPHHNPMSAGRRRGIKLSVCDCPDSPTFARTYHLFLGSKLVRTLRLWLSVGSQLPVHGRALQRVRLIFLAHKIEKDNS